MNQYQTNRHDLRTGILARREDLSNTDRQKKSNQILSALTTHESFKQAKTIFSYINFRSEVITESLIEVCKNSGKRLCVPLTVRQNSQLVPYELTDSRNLHSGYCGIPEPDVDTCTLVASNTIDLTILPGSVFDRYGGRLGYGGGFYDRFLVNKAPNSVRIGLAFDLQLVAEKLPLLPHDQSLHYLFTENSILNFT